MIRSTPLRKVSRKRAAQRYDYEQAKAAAWLRDGGRCQADWPEVDCAGPLDPHHIATQRMYPELRCDPENLLTLCRAHHQAVHEDTKTARRKGLLR